MNLISAAAVAEQGGGTAVREKLLPGSRVGEAKEHLRAPTLKGSQGQAGGGRVGEQGPSGATHKGPAAQSACGGRQTPLSLLLSPPRLVSISLMLFTSSPNLSKEYGSHVFRFI